jgi:hypothetical protein
MALEFYAYPHLMGESVDYEIDDLEDESDSDSDDKEKEDGKKADEEANKELPKRMEGLEITDADGVVEMEL